MPEAGGAGRSARPTWCLSDLAPKDPDPQDRRSGGDAPKLQAGGRSWAFVSSVRRKQCFHRPALHLAIPGPARPGPASPPEWPIRPSGCGERGARHHKTGYRCAAGWGDRAQGSACSYDGPLRLKGRLDVRAHCLGRCHSMFPLTCSGSDLQPP